MSAVEEYVEHFRARVLQDALNEATSRYCLRRAAQFEWARPALGDFTGTATDIERRAKWHELTGIARACRNRAAVSLIQDGIEPEVFVALREAS